MTILVAHTRLSCCGSTKAADGEVFINVKLTLNLKLPIYVLLNLPVYVLLNLFVKP